MTNLLQYLSQLFRWKLEERIRWLKNFSNYKVGKTQLAETFVKKPKNAFWKTKFVAVSMVKKRQFPLRISSVNVTKFGHVY